MASKKIEERFKDHGFELLSLGGNVENWGIESQGESVVIVSAYGDPPEAMTDPVIMAVYDKSGEDVARFAFKTLRAFFESLDAGQAA